MTNQAEHGARYLARLLSDAALKMPVTHGTNDARIALGSFVAAFLAVFQDHLTDAQKSDLLAFVMESRFCVAGTPLGGGDWWGVKIAATAERAP